MIQGQDKLKFYFGRLSSQRKTKTKTGPSLAALWLKLCASITGGKGSVPRKGIRFCMPHNPPKKKQKEKHSNTNTNQ